MHFIKASSFTKNIKFLFLFALSLFFLQRLGLFFWSLSTLTFDLTQLVKALLIGFVFDASLIVYALFPHFLLFFLFPKLNKVNLAQKTFSIGLDILNFLFIFFVFYMVVSELFFWDEFTSRYNFIAIDYLVYTTEVLKNIWESYPTFKIITGLVIISLLTLMQLNKYLDIEVTSVGAYKQKLRLALIYICVLGVNYLSVSQNYVEALKDIGYQEIAKNGAYSLFYSYFQNEINYDQFYMQLDTKQATESVRADLRGARFLSNDIENIQREILYPQNNSTQKNVVLVLMESMGARFMSSYGNKLSITPNLDRLASQGLFFNNLYATGTRTVRGIEAVTLSLPPTPGQSIVRRPNNENLVTLNKYFLDSNYSVSFVYGGYSYFDNMKYYFKNNGATVLDRDDIDPSKITFSNAWGVCDEDLFRFSIQNADLSFKNQKPFFQIVLTTSNHRPFTYPDKKIDLRSGSGRSGGVKYADFAIGKFLEEAQTKPWFENTIFVFVADHDAGVAGNTEVVKKDYLIPVIFYAPQIIKPETVSKLASQIDVGPTLLGLLKMNHVSYGFGQDLQKTSPERAFISNYQKVGLLKANFLTLLEVGKKYKQYSISGTKYAPVDYNKDELDETISIYQTASHIFKNNQLKSHNEAFVSSH